MNQNQPKKQSCCDKFRSIFKRKQDIPIEQDPNKPVSMVTEKPFASQVSTLKINEIQEEVHEQFLKDVIQTRKGDWMKFFQNRQIFTIEKLVLAFQNSKTSIVGRKANGAELSVLERIYRNFNSGLTTYNWVFQDAQLLDLKSQQNPIKNVLVLGITGQGKSTFINSFYNSLQGFKFEQPVRYKIIKDPNENTKAKSVTKEVKSYGMNVHNFCFNMIDTPGLADTDGPQRDQIIADQISEFILEELHKNNQRLHQVVLVSQSSTDYQIKDSPTLNQLAILNVLKLFGKDMSLYHTHVLTFSDFTQANQSNYESQSSIFNSLTTQYLNLEQSRQFSSPQFTGSPSIVDQESQNLLSIRDQRKCYCQLQNSVFFTKEVGVIQKIQLRKNLENYNKLIEKINGSEGFTLHQTSVVITERKNIREKITILNDELRIRVKIDQILQSNIKKLQLFQERMDQTEDFEFIELETIKRRVNTNYFVTNCSVCQNSCHIDCKVPTESLITCNMMIEQEDGYFCAACCHNVQTHQNDNFKFVKDFIEKKIIKEDLKAEHISAQEQHERIKNYQELQMQKQLENDLKIKILLGELRYSFNQLYTSALYQVDFKGQSLKEFLYKYFNEYANKKMLDRFFEDEIDLLATKKQLDAIPLIQQTMVFRLQNQPALQ